MKIGIIGFGYRISILLNILKKLDGDYQLAAITDIRNEEIKDRLKSEGEDPSRIEFFEKAEDMIEKSRLDCIFIGTRCSLHTEMALKVIPTSIPLFLEKPITTSLEDYKRLSEACSAYPQSSERILVSFPLRVTPLAQLVKEIISSGKIGTVEHVQAVNNVPYGGVYFHDWYRDENETKGLFLQKATHDFDYINAILGIKPVRICAMTSKQIFKGDKPAKLMCKDCPDADTCMESPRNLSLHANEESTGQYCSFAVDTGNEDSGSALVQYETGMHVSYSQNFFARKGAAARGARFFGYNGTVEFDWYTDEVKVFMHHTPRNETYKVDSSKLQHSGGDQALMLNFIEMVKTGQKPVAPVEAGLTSALMCLKARESAKSGTFCDIQIK